MANYNSIREAATDYLESWKPVYTVVGDYLANYKPIYNGALCFLSVMLRLVKKYPKLVVLFVDVSLCVLFVTSLSSNMLGFISVFSGMLSVIVFFMATERMAAEGMVFPFFLCILTFFITFPMYMGSL